METNCTFPDDLLEEILGRLPGRQLLRFRCVSKSWCAIIDNPRFLYKHHQSQYAILKEQGDIPLLMDNGATRDGVPQIYFFSEKYKDDVLLYVTPDLQRDCAPKNMKHFEGVRCMGCANGVVLLEWSVPPKLSMWNPTNREFKVVPPRKPRLSREYYFGESTLGFDPESNDFKIIRSIVGSSDRKEYSYEMYSLNTNSWKSIENPFSPHDPSLNILGSCIGFGVYISNIHYWACRSNVRVVDCEKSFCILSFDFCKEKFQVLSAPSRQGKYYCSVGNYHGSLAFICGFTTIYKEQRSVERMEIWVMTKVDDRDIPYSWQHLFTTGPFSETSISLYSFRFDGDILIELYTGPTEDDRNVCHHESCLYNIATKKITKRFGFVMGMCYEYVESLFKLSKRI